MQALELRGRLGRFSTHSSTYLLTLAGGVLTVKGAYTLLYSTPNGQVMLALSGVRGATQFAVLNAVGRVVLSQQLPASTGTITHVLDLSGAAKGVYLLHLSSPAGVVVRRLTYE